MVFWWRTAAGASKAGQDPCGAAIFRCVLRKKEAEQNIFHFSFWQPNCGYSQTGIHSATFFPPTLNFCFSTILPGDYLLKPEQTHTQNQNRQNPNSSPNPTCYFNLELPGSCSVCQCIHSVSTTYLSFEVYWIQHK